MLAKSAMKPLCSLGVVITRPDAIRRFVLEIVQQTKSNSKWMSNANPFRRRPVYLSFEVTPVEYAGGRISLVNEGCRNLPVTSRDLSLKGIGFQHDLPIEAEHVVATFPALDELRLGMLVERRWSKPLEGGEFLSGGRFVGVVVLRGRQSEAEDGEPGWQISLAEGDSSLSIEARSQRLLDIIADHLPACVEIGGKDEPAAEGERRG